VTETNPPAPRHRATTDLAWVAAVTVLVFALTAGFEFFEAYSRFMQRLERWQGDELVFALAALALGMAWYAMRRWREARESLALHLRSEERVGELLAHNRELAQRLIGVQESERRALARELHDELGQSCTAIRVEAALIERGAARDTREVQAAAARIGAVAEALYQQVRQMLRRLRPADLDALGLVAALQSLCEAWEASSGVACVLHHDGSFDGTGDAVDIAVYRVAQEALSNVMRHARATSVRVTLAREADAGLLLAVRDDGVGMDVAAERHGLGLLGATERAAALGGTLAIESGAGAGVRLALHLPHRR